MVSFWPLRMSSGRGDAFDDGLRREARLAPGAGVTNQMYDGSHGLNSWWSQFSTVVDLFSSFPALGSAWPQIAPQSAEKARDVGRFESFSKRRHQRGRQAAHTGHGFAQQHLFDAVRQCQGQARRPVVLQDAGNGRTIGRREGEAGPRLGPVEIR